MKINGANYIIITSVKLFNILNKAYFLNYNKHFYEGYYFSLISIIVLVDSKIIKIYDFQREKNNMHIHIHDYQ